MIIKREGVNVILGGFTCEGQAEHVAEVIRALAAEGWAALVLERKFDAIPLPIDAAVRRGLAHLREMHGGHFTLRVDGDHAGAPAKVDYAAGGTVRLVKSAS